MDNELIQPAVWFAACQVADVPKDGGVCVKYISIRSLFFISAGAANGLQPKIFVRTNSKCHLAAE